MECEECGRDDLPLLVFIAGLVDPDKPNRVHQISVYLCAQCADAVPSKVQHEASSTVH
jgi:hypothetical protein